jgi:hypothetical protein
MLMDMSFKKILNVHFTTSFDLKEPVDMGVVSFKLLKVREL